MTNDLLMRTAVDLVSDMAEGRLSAVDLMRATLDRVAALNPSLNAIISLRDRDVLLREAAEKDAVPAEQRGPLHGLPLAAKDFVDVAGLPTRMGSPLTPKGPVKADDILAQRMRAAGVIYIGKTNVPEFGYGSHTYNTVFGTTSNPYDITRSAGGSSGGAAVALATGMLAIADGSDMMGSLRNPAGWNNVYGMRPSIGRLPGDIEGDVTLFPIVTNGPMARNPRDLARLLDVQAGPDRRFPTLMAKENLADVADIDLKGKRIGWLGDWGGAYGYEPGILALCEQALKQFEAMGAAVTPLAPPFSAQAMWDSWMTLRGYVIAHKIGDLVRNPAHRAHIKPEAIWEAEFGFTVTADAVHKASVIRSDWFRKSAALFAEFDALILPSAQVWPFPKEWTWPKAINGVEMDTYHRWMEVVVPASLAGLPAISIPAGFGDNGLPMGMQVIGQHGNDAAILAIAQAWHRVTDWPNTRPPKIYL